MTVSMCAALLVATQAVVANKSTPGLSEKEVLKALMKNLDVRLKDAAHCKGVGTDEHDRTIGDYLSGFLAFHANMQGKNWLDISATKSDQGTYLAKVMIYRKDGEENWGWGVSFMLDSSKKVKRNSFTCLGSG